MSGQNLEIQTPFADDVVLDRVVWSDAYGVGVPEMDKQHQKLIGLINRLVDIHATPSAESSERFHEVLSAMFDYTRVHFKYEELYMTRIGYPNLAAHGKEHAAFVDEMAEFCMASISGVRDIARVHGYLKGWLLSHILQSDMHYREFVERGGAKLSS